MCDAKPKRGATRSRRAGPPAVIRLPYATMAPSQRALRPRRPDGGCYAILLRLPAVRTLVTGALGAVDYPAGWYVYVGSARGGIRARVARHRRPAKALRWHIDYLRRVCSFVDAFAFPHPPHLSRESEIARAVAAIADEAIPRFGASDSPDASHLFRFDHDPRTDPRFVLLCGRANNGYLLSWVLTIVPSARPLGTKMT